MPNLLVEIFFFPYINHMEFADFKTGPDDINRRLDKVLRHFLSESRLSEIYKFIRKGLIKVNSKKTNAEYRIVQDDIINIANFLITLEKEKSSQEKVDTKLEFATYNTVLPPINFPTIVFENEHFLIIDKPYNVNVHGDENSLEKIVSKYYHSKYKNNSLSFEPGPLHRLDKKTTGLLVFSFSHEGAQWFSKCIQNHTITKKYYGIVQGKLQNTQTWCNKILSEEKSGKRKKFDTVKISETGKEAVTIATPVSYNIYKNEPITLVSFEIKTGRKHQIRAQSAFHNHPLLGDTAYGGKKIQENRDFYLQAYELTFPENNFGLPGKIKLPLADDMVYNINNEQNN